jgi:hypothetical protein
MSSLCFRLTSLAQRGSHFRSALIALNEKDADKAQNMFNSNTTLRGSFIAIAGHFGEHLGQSIATRAGTGMSHPGLKVSRSNSRSPWTSQTVIFSMLFAVINA